MASAAVLVALLPATVGAAAVTKFQDRTVEAFCESAFDGGYASTGIITSTASGNVGFADVWLDPAVPFEDPTSMTGATDTPDVTEGAEIVLHATIPVVDADGNPIGDAELTATVSPVGDPELIAPDPGKSNHHSLTSGTRQNLEGSATFVAPGVDIVLPCSGDITDVNVHESSPHSFVSSNAGTIIQCFWDEGETQASLFAIDDDFGFFVDASLSTPDLLLFPSGDSTGTLTETAFTMTSPLVDDATGDPFLATASATFTNIGNAVTSTFISQDARSKSVQQALAADGTLDFTTGDSFVMDAEHCQANTFDTHSHVNTPAVPQPGVAPANDTPDGATPLTARSKVNQLTGGTAPDAEVPITTCPEASDDLGHTVWFTVVGSGNPITVDTSGSDFDTVVAVYDLIDGAPNEIACDDDVNFVPIGGSLQTKLTFDTEAGVVYYIQVGGFKNFFGGDAQFGRLRLTAQ
jgi:hypothetical protein